MSDARHLVNFLQTIARHVMNIHMDRADTSTAVNGEIDVDKMKKFIAYCKWYGSSEPFLSLFLFYFISRKCAPRLSEDAMEMLSSHFVSLRRQVQQVEKDNDERSSIPITIRQLRHFCSRYRLMKRPGNLRQSPAYLKHQRRSHSLPSFWRIMQKNR